MSLNQLNKIYRTIDKNFDLSHLKEFTIEANPGEFSFNKMKDFKSLGVNRVSFGFQSLDDKILKFLSRWHSSEDCIQSYDNARKAGFDNINIDMIFGIPEQSMIQWKKDLNSIIKLDPEHVSAYSLIVEEKTPLYTEVNSGRIRMPYEKTDIEMYSYTMDILNQGGYAQYEISNYSKINMRCKHNLHYWRREPYLAFGPSAHGFYNKRRYWNTKDLNNYNERLESNELPVGGTEILKKENIFNEIILNGLRISDGINMELLQNRFSKTTFNILSKKKMDWGDHLEKNKKNIRLTKKGYFIADEITLDLMNSFN